MFNRSALLLASAAMLGVSLPAAAQDSRYGDAGELPDVSWEQREVVQPLAELERGEHRRAMRHRRHEQRGEHEMDHDPRPRLAYSAEERAAWLADCRIVMRSEDYYYDDARYEDEDGNGGLIGGLLGAVVGGVAGNRIGGAGDRLAGTLIGAGVGGIAGAVIGSAIDGDDDNGDYRTGYDRNAEEAWAADYCEAYLRRYEASGQAGYGQIAYMQVQPVMVLTGGGSHGGYREIVREEWVDVPADHTERRTRRRMIERRAAPEQGKLTPTN